MKKVYCGNCKFFRNGYYPIPPQCKVEYELYDDLHGRHKRYPHSNLKNNDNYDCGKYEESSLFQKFLRLIGGQ